MQKRKNETAYVLGSTDAELERLMKQAHLFQAQTRSHRARTTHRYPRTQEAQKAQAEEKQQRL